MNVRIISAGAAILAGLALCSPAWAVCLPVWGTICRPATTPSEQASSETTSNKPNKPLNLRKFVRNGTAVQWKAKRTRVARGRHPVVAAKVSHSRKNIVLARSRRGTTQRVAAARKPVVTVDEPASVAATKQPNAAAAPDDTAANTRAPSPASPVEREATTTGASGNDEARPQDELNPLDLAADTPKPESQAAPPSRAADVLTADAPPAGTVAAANSPAPTPEPNAAPTPAAAPQASPAPAAAPASPAPTADTPPAKQRTEVSGPAPQPPAEETSWLRRIAIGVGGLVTLASAVRLFAG